MNQSDTDIWKIKHCGGVYKIIYDHNRRYLQPKWFVRRMNDLRESTRFYSWPNGAFTALSEGSIIWN